MSTQQPNTLCDAERGSGDAPAGTCDRGPGCDICAAGYWKPEPCRSCGVLMHDEPSRDGLCMKCYRHTQHKWRDPRCVLCQIEIIEARERAKEIVAQRRARCSGA